MSPSIFQEERARDALDLTDFIR